jgi:hypothetical protein
MIEDMEEFKQESTQIEDRVDIDQNMKDIN